MLLGNLTDGVDCVWDYAEQHGVADRLVVVIGSDFGVPTSTTRRTARTHWPIGSYVFMEKGRRWTNELLSNLVYGGLVMRRPCRPV